MTRVTLAMLLLACLPAQARDDGRWAQSPLKSWFDGLTNQRGGQCCSFADGMTIRDVDWSADANGYRVRVEGQWLDVPASALVTVPNRLGSAVVWPFYDWQAKAWQVRCFMPGTLS